MAQFRVESRAEGGVMYVTLAGEFDLAGIQQFESVLGKVEADAPETIVIDLSQLAFMDSSGLRALVMADQRAHREGRRLAIVPGPPSVRRVFEITQLHDQLDLIESASGL
ncbi:MAG TPA: STAS domain-containing protein [Thermoleophilaceae bacterium]|jgi:anti-anti-sigma factor|nr:STAS domain-containing protein [Thermoleophilaceae bacterium]